MRPFILFVILFLGVHSTKLFANDTIPPTYKGGEAAMAKFLASHVKYPRDAVKSGAQGIVIVSFIVDKTGKIRNAESKSPELHASLQQEAVRVISIMPPWVPGTINDTVRAFIFSLPIKFSVENR